MWLHVKDEKMTWSKYGREAFSAKEQCFLWAERNLAYSFLSAERKLHSKVTNSFIV
jgi:hypothetical protein